MKKLIVLFGFMALASTCAYSQSALYDTVGLYHDFDECPIHIMPCDKSLLVYGYDEYDGIFIMSERDESVVVDASMEELMDEQNCVWIFIPYSEWKDGTYFVSLIGEKKYFEGRIDKKCDTFVLSYKTGNKNGKWDNNRRQ